MEKARVSANSYLHSCQVAHALFLSQDMRHHIVGHGRAKVASEAR